MGSYLLLFALLLLAQTAESTDNSTLLIDAPEKPSFVFVPHKGRSQSTIMIISIFAGSSYEHTCTGGCFGMDLYLLRKAAHQRKYTCHEGTIRKYLYYSSS